MQAERIQNWSQKAKQDITIIAGLSALTLFLAFVFAIPERIPTSVLVPYFLLWLVLCFAGFVYRRWRQALANGGFQQSEIANWSWDIAEGKREWSDEMFTIFGVLQDSFSTTYPEILSLIHPEDRHQYEQIVAQSLRDNIGYAFDFRVCMPSGEVRIVHEKSEVLFDAAKPVKMTGTVTDVTERKHIETDLRDRFDLLQSLIDAIPVPVFHKNEKGIYTGCNKAFEDFYGKTRDKIVGKTVYEIAPPDLAVIYENADKALFRQGGSQIYEVRIVNADGTPHDVIFHKAVLTKNDGSVGGLIGTIIDISDRKRMEFALRDSEQRFRNIAESASDWFWETDNKHRFSYLSDKLKDILGASTESVLGKSRQELAGQEQIEENRQKWQQHQDDLNHHRAFRDLVYVFTPLSGAEHHIRINGVPVFDDDGVFHGYRGTGTDITDHVRVENALRESEERHRNFAADVAHELRTPLAVLRTHLDNLSESKEVQSLRLDVDSMTRLVAQLLAMTRIETFTAEDALHDVDLGDVCRNVATLIAPLAIKEHRSIEVTGAKLPVLVRGDSASLEQAVRNLVENAIRYSARGTVITLNVDGREDPTLKVIDRGRGIALGQRENIFQRFKRSDRRGGGSGLGLSIVKRTVNNHDGEIRIEDTPEGGATFVIIFPPANGDIEKTNAKNTN